MTVSMDGDLLSRLDPELSVALARIPAGAQGARLEDLRVVHAMRDTPALMAAIGRSLPVDERVQVADGTFTAGDGTELPLRLYVPSHHDGGVLVFFHGGGFVMGDVYTEEQRCLLLAAEGRCIVVSVGYRLAPEDPFPTGVEDCYQGLVWAFEHAASLGGDPARVGVGGSSAGGGLSAAVSLMARDRGLEPLALQLLVYPMLDDRLDTPSMAMGDSLPLWSRSAARRAWDHYLGGQPASHYAAPARAEDLLGLPPAYVSTAELDPLRDEGIAYGRRLVEAGVPTEMHHFPGTFHGFDLVAPRSAVSRRALAEQTGAVLRALAP